MNFIWQMNQQYWVCSLFLISKKIFNSIGPKTFIWHMNLKYLLNISICKNTYFWRMN
jgi:hypothetical protein